MSNKTSYTPDAQLDTRGLYCPEPVMLMHSRVRDMQPSQILEVTATDPATQRDVPNFCRFLGHTLLVNETTDSAEFHYVIRLKST